MIQSILTGAGGRTQLLGDPPLAATIPVAGPTWQKKGAFSFMSPPMMTGVPVASRPLMCAIWARLADARSVTMP